MTTSRLVATMALTLLSGCSALFPRLREYQGAEANHCVERSYSKAQAFASATASEIEGIQLDYDYLQYGVAYTGLAVASATAGAVAFDASKNVLKGLALGAGGLIGLDAVTNPKAQRVVLNRASDALLCVSEAAAAAYTGSEAMPEENLESVSDMAMHGSDARSRGANQALSEFARAFDRSGEIESLDAMSTVDIPTSKRLYAIEAFVPPAVPAAPGSLEAFGAQQATEVIAAAQAQAAALGQAALELEQLRESTGRLLSGAVCEIRNDVRKGLRDSIPGVEKLMSTQRKTVSSILSDLLKAEDKAADAGKKAGTDAAGSGAKVEQAIQALGKANTPDGKKAVAAAEQLAALSAKLDQGLKSPREIYAKCFNATTGEKKPTGE